MIKAFDLQFEEVVHLLGELLQRPRLQLVLVRVILYGEIPEAPLWVDDPPKKVKHGVDDMGRCAPEVLNKYLSRGLIFKLIEPV